MAAALDTIDAGILTADTAAAAAVPKSVVTTAGDIFYATGNAAVTRLALGAAGNVLLGGASAPSYGKVTDSEITANTLSVNRLVAGTAGQVLGGTGPSYSLPPGYEYAYTEFTSAVSITATTEGTANTVVTASAVTFDGSTVVLIEFSAPSVKAGTGNIIMCLFEDGTAIGNIGFNDNAGKFVPMRLGRRRTPANGSRTYSVRAFVDAGTGSVTGGAGGAGANVPGWIRITKV